MEALHSLVHRLCPGEIQLVQTYLHCFSSHKSEDVSPEGSSRTKTNRLFDYLLKHKTVPSASDCCIYVYGTSGKTNESFKTLKNRLLNKLFDATSSELNSEKSNALSELDKINVRLKQKAATLRYYFCAKPGLPVISELLDEIIFMSRKYEFYDLLIEHLKFKKWRFAFKEKHGKKNVARLSREIKHYEKCNRALATANDYYLQLVFISECEGKHKIATIKKFSEKSIPKLNTLYLETRSPGVLYYKNYIELFYRYSMQDYLDARRICFKLSEIITNEPSVRSKTRIGILYDYFSRCELYLGNYDNAAECARIAQDNFTLNSGNYSIAKEQEFYALFYGGDYSKAETVAVEMVNSAPQKEHGAIHFSNYYFLHACLFFRLRKFHDALNALDRDMEFSANKEGWRFDWRVLRIMTNIELGEEDKSSSEIDNLRMYIMNNENKFSFSQRHKTIVDFLSSASCKSFRFSELNGKAQNYIELLSSPDNDYSWKILSSELIPFHEWAAGKTRLRIVGNKNQHHLVRRSSK
jgi:hypothetical protein